MKKNFIQRHTIWISLLVFCFMVVPNIRNGYAMETDHTPVLALNNTKDKATTSKKKVVLDPGHGGFDGGGESSNGIIEKDVTLKIAKKVGAILEKQQIEVIYTRSEDKVSWGGNSLDDLDEVKDLNERSKIANASGATCFVSLHTNYSDILQDEITGNEVWVKAEDEDSMNLAQDINAQFKKITKAENRGIKDQAMAPLQLLISNNVPSVLIETGFLSNNEEATYINSEEGITTYANAIANGILDYIQAA